MPRLFDDVGEAVEATLNQVGRRLVLGTPLGIGKPNALLNEFYRRAARDPAIDLSIMTALSLARPRPRSDLEARLLEPLNARIFADYVELDYVRALREGTLPANIRVHEFFLQAGAWLGVDAAQQAYHSSNYTHVARDLIAAGVNVIAQQVAVRGSGSSAEYSLSSNPDLTLDLLPSFAAARAAGRPVALVAVVNRQLPFMPGDSEVPVEAFDFIVDHPRYESALFAPPSAPISRVEHAIGLHASALIRDGGTLELGIGELGDAVVYALQLRQQQNAEYVGALTSLGALERFGAEISAIGGLQPFVRGLYGCTEMLVDGFLDLYRTGILKRAVFPHAVLQRLLDAGLITERPDEAALACLAEAGLTRIEAADFAALAQAGLFLPGTRYEDGQIVAPSGLRVPADLASAQHRRSLAASALAPRLDGGALLHAGFFVGPRGFYAALRALPEQDRRRFHMTAISYTNQLYGEGMAVKVAQRRHARFLNSAMMVTGLGAVVSDALDSERVVSGVGGQYNFVAMAHELPGGRALFLVRSTRTKAGRTSSNILWSYGHTTIPRHLRDIVVTEYGIADLRGRSDRDCVVALLGITDARFQDELLAEARRAGKIERGFRIPDSYRRNTPARLDGLRSRQRDGFFSDYPFGTDFTAEEALLVRALPALAQATATTAGLVATVARACLGRVDRARCRPLLERMGLGAPRGIREWLSARLLAWAVTADLAESPRPGAGAP
jgi:acyl-CoA hydrolase